MKQKIARHTHIHTYIHTSGILNVCMYLYIYSHVDGKGIIIPELVEMTFIDVKGTVERWPPIEGAEEEDEVGPLELPSYKLALLAVVEVGAVVELLWGINLMFK